MYKKILKSLAISTISAIIITAVGIILALRNSSGNILSLSWEFFILASIVIAIVCLGAMILSLIFVEKIITPIKELDLSAETHENVYAELVPLVSRIERQNREISRHVDRVKRQKTRLQAVGESMSEGLIVFDGDGNILSLNPSAEKIFNAQTSVIGDNFFRLSKNIEIFDAIERACKGERVVISETIYEKLYQIYLSPTSEKGIVNSVIMLMIDVNELAKTENMRREFTANVSHELKTPLTTILGYSQIINNGIAKDEDIKDFTGRIEKETTRLITLVDDIMKLSRLDEAEGIDDFSEIHLLDITKEVKENLAHKAEKNKISFSLSGEDAIIKGNPSQISELIYNLLDNAIKYNRENGKVEIEIFENGFSVSDTGIGIPEKYIDRIYERFFRVDKSHSKTIGGTGLGLSIVKHIAQCHGAIIDLESQEGKGTKFTVKFPI